MAAGSSAGAGFTAGTSAIAGGLCSCDGFWSRSSGMLPVLGRRLRFIRRGYRRGRAGLALRKQVFVDDANAQVPRQVHVTLLRILVPSQFGRGL